MDALAVGAARLAGERLPGGAGFLAGVPAALAGGVGGIGHDAQCVGVLQVVRRFNAIFNRKGN